jgi:hypothetical protein
MQSSGTNQSKQSDDDVIQQARQHAYQYAGDGRSHTERSSSANSAIIKSVRHVEGTTWRGAPAFAPSAPLPYVPPRLKADKRSHQEPSPRMCVILIPVVAVPNRTPAASCHQGRDPEFASTRPETLPEPLHRGPSGRVEGGQAMKRMTLLSASILAVGAYAAGPDSLSGTATITTTVIAPAATTSPTSPAPAAIDATKPNGTTGTCDSGTGGVVTVVSPRPVDTIGPAPQPISPMPPPQSTGAAPMSAVPAPPMRAPLSVRTVGSMVTDIPGPEAPALITIDRPALPD